MESVKFPEVFLKPLRHGMCKASVSSRTPSSSMSAKDGDQWHFDGVEDAPFGRILPSFSSKTSANLKVMSASSQA